MSAIARTRVLRQNLLDVWTVWNVNGSRIRRRTTDRPSSGGDDGRRGDCRLLIASRNSAETEFRLHSARGRAHTR